MATKERSRRKITKQKEEIFKKEKPLKSDKDINKEIKVLNSEGIPVKIIKNDS